LKYIREVTKLTIPSNRPIVGDAIFAVEAVGGD